MDRRSFIASGTAAAALTLAPCALFARSAGTPETRVLVEVKNEPGALGTIATIIGVQKANIVNLRLDNRDTGIHTNTIDVEVHDVQHLVRVIAALRAADAVNSVERV